MRSLSNRTKRISSNSIKQNHNVGPPVSNSVQCLECSVQNPGSIVQSPASRVQLPTLASVQKFRYAVRKTYCCALPKADLLTELFIHVNKSIIN